MFSRLVLAYELRNREIISIPVEHKPLASKTAPLTVQSSGHQKGGFHLGTRFQDRPLIYPILHKCLIFTVVIICFHIVEGVLVGIWHGGTVMNSLPPKSDRSLKIILSKGALCFVLLLPLFCFREIGRVIGREELWSLVFRARSHHSLSSPEPSL